MCAPQRTHAPPPGSPAGSACSEQAPAGAAAPGGTAPPHAPQRRPTSSASAAALPGSQHAPHLPRARSCRRAPLRRRVCAAALVPPCTLSRNCVSLQQTRACHAACPTCGAALRLLRRSIARLLRMAFALCLGRSSSSGDHPPALKVVLAYKQPLALHCHVLPSLPPPSNTPRSGSQRYQRLQTAALYQHRRQQARRPGRRALAQAMHGHT